MAQNASGTSFAATVKSRSARSRRPTTRLDTGGRRDRRLGGRHQPRRKPRLRRDHVDDGRRRRCRRRWSATTRAPNLICNATRRVRRRGRVPRSTPAAGCLPHFGTVRFGVSMDYFDDRAVDVADRHPTDAPDSRARAAGRRTSRRARARTGTGCSAPTGTCTRSAARSGSRVSSPDATAMAPRARRQGLLGRRPAPATCSRTARADVLRRRRRARRRRVRQHDLGDAERRRATGCSRTRAARSRSATRASSATCRART